MDSKIEELQIAMAHQDRQIADLNDMITRQWGEIDRLRRDLNMALGRVKALEAATPDGEREGLSSIEQAALDIPPHY
ncbi:SlyX family protein [Micavibrio aeruginosavorus]|uniref:SlyX family protein n=1 Tax=Micavibrio aeruginosavorus (strain ARL-13) TaxID=856793 RepID=G2KS51_MICAA|nr:SlyX family protein [Micavibrio aeruginosavorus]AEP08734.1 slyX family protein [Micavibrio aeruginosavorus ARL-13]